MLTINHTIKGHGQISRKYGIDPQKGASVILMPDQYISWAGEADDYDDMEHFFSAFMKLQSHASHL